VALHSCSAGRRQMDVSALTKLSGDAGAVWPEQAGLASPGWQRIRGARFPAGQDLKLVLWPAGSGEAKSSWRKRQPLGGVKMKLAPAAARIVDGDGRIVAFVGTDRRGLGDAPSGRTERRFFDRDR